MAMIRCRCDAVEIQFDIDHDLYRNECCCHDCTSALWYAHQQGGPAAPPYQCVDNSWLPNDFEIKRGLEHLGALLNFPAADSTRFYCRQCWTILFADHPAYAKRVVVTAANNFSAFEALSGIKLMPVQGRHFLRDLTNAARAAIPPWSGDSAHVYEGPSERLLAEFPALQAAGSEGREMNAQILLETVGPALIPSDEPRLKNGPPTMLQRNAAESR